VYTGNDLAIDMVLYGSDYLHLTDGLDAPEVHPRAPRRPDSEAEVLRDCARRIGAL
jgi:hypothetical protein